MAGSPGSVGLPFQVDQGFQRPYMHSRLLGRAAQQAPAHDHTVTLPHYHTIRLRVLSCPGFAFASRYSGTGTSASGALRCALPRIPRRAASWSLLRDGDTDSQGTVRASLD